MGAKLVVVGGGRMGGALVGGLLGRGWAEAEELVVVELLAARRAELAAAHPGLVLAGEVPSAPAGGAVVAVEPDGVRAACAALAAAGVRRILSVAAGVTLASLEAWSGGGDLPVAVVRAMPNTPALVGAGASAVAAGSAAGDADLEWARTILESVGTVVTVDERLLDAVTGLSGSGPAYLFLVAEALIDAGVLAGLPRGVARDLAVQTLLGSARLLAGSGEGPEALRARVTSPGGTTAAGLRALEAHAVRAAITDAVMAATQRAAELGRGASCG